MSISLLLHFETNDFRHFDLYKTNFCSFFFFAFVIRLNNVTDDRKKKTTVVFLDFFLICVFSILNLIIFILHTCSVRKITQTKIKSI